MLEGVGGHRAHTAPRPGTHLRVLPGLPDHDASEPRVPGPFRLPLHCLDAVKVHALHLRDGVWVWGVKRGGWVRVWRGGVGGIVGVCGGGGGNLDLDLGADLKAHMTPGGGGGSMASPITHMHIGRPCHIMHTQVLDGPLPLVPSGRASPRHRWATSC